MARQALYEIGIEIEKVRGEDSFGITEYRNGSGRALKFANQTYANLRKEFPGKKINVKVVQQEKN
jgi:hypothetical protein